MNSSTVRLPEIESPHILGGLDQIRTDELLPEEQAKFDASCVAIQTAAISAACRVCESPTEPHDIPAEYIRALAMSWVRPPRPEEAEARGDVLGTLITMLEKVPANMLPTAVSALHIARLTVDHSPTQDITIGTLALVRGQQLITTRPMVWYWMPGRTLSDEEATRLRALRRVATPRRESVRLRAWRPV